jgi:O-antigen ligase
VSALPRFGGRSDAARTGALLAVILGAMLIAARIADPLFYVLAAVLLIVLAVVAYVAPQAMLIGVIFAPIIDRYLASMALPAHLHDSTTYFSEVLLLIVAAGVTLRGIRAGTLLPALRSPVVAFLAAFVGVGGISAVANGVPPLVAGAGILFTVDAAVLFVLPRIVGFTIRQATIAASGFVAIALLAALLALAQVVLDPNFLGLESFAGRFSEGNRIASFLVNPNMLGVMLAMAIPITSIAVFRLTDTRWRTAAAAATAFLVLALLYTFSRGAWLGLGTGMLLVGLVLERRALVLVLLAGALAFGAAFVIPRDVLLDPAERLNTDLGGGTFGRFDSLDGSDLRLLFIENAAPIVADHPVIGAGPGRYGGAIAWRLGTPLSDEYTAGAVPRDRTVDNFWLHLTVEFGVLGVLLFLSALAIAVRQLMGAARHAAGWHRGLLASFAAIAVVLVMDSLTEMLLEGNTTSYSLWFFLGVGTVLAAVTGTASASRASGGAPAAQGAQ